MDPSPGIAKKMVSKHKFSFNDEYDQVLVEVIIASGAHVAKYGTKMKKFEGCHAMFLASPAYIAYKEKGGTATPSPTTLRERFTYLIKKRRTDVAAEISASGQAVEDPTPLQIDLDSVIEEIETHKALDLEKKAEEVGKAHELHKRGIEMRDCAMARKASKNDGTDPPKSKKVRRGAAFNALFELDALEEDTKKHYELEEKRIALEEKKLALEEKKLAQSMEKDKVQNDLMMALLAQLKK